MLHKLYDFQLPIEEMVNIYILYIRSILESSAVVWQSSLTNYEQIELECVQKVALRIILKTDYESFEQALTLKGLQTLDDRGGQHFVGNLPSIVSKMSKPVICFR